jgi:phosphonate transport system substrate-binding protein
MKMLFRSSVFFLTAALAVLPLSGGRADDALHLSFGVYTSDKPTDMYRAFKPILVYLEGALSESLSKPVQIKLRVFNSYDSARDALVNEEVDFVRFGPSSYILAKEKNPGVQILVIEEQEGQYQFKGVIFTRVDSGINAIKDLKGRSFAFGDPDSTIGRYLSQSFLVGAGIHQKDLWKHEYLERHDRVVDAVVSGKFDAGAAKEGTYAKFKDKGLKVLETFDNITKPWVARSKLDAATTGAIRKSLAALKDKKVLDALGEKITGFNSEVAKDEMYDPVREGMKRAE